MTSDWVICNTYHVDNIGNFAGTMTAMIKAAYPDARYIDNLNDAYGIVDKKKLLVLAKPSKMHRMLEEFSKWERVVGWCFEAVNTTDCNDNLLLYNRGLIEEVNKVIEVCHIDRESAKQLGCKWLPIGYSKVLEAELPQNKKWHMLFVGDNDPKKTYRRALISKTKSSVLSSNPNNSIDVVTKYIARYYFGLHVPANPNYTNVNWHRLMLYYSNKVMPVLVGPDNMEVPEDLPYIRLDGQGLIAASSKLAYDGRRAKKALHLVRTRYDFKHLIDNVLENKSIVVLGHTGLLGRYVHKYLQLCTNFNIISWNNFDAKTATAKDIKQRLLDIGGKVECVVNCIGVIKQRKDIDDGTMYDVNSAFPLRLRDVCKDIGSKMIHISTDCVFPGTTGGYTEIDEPTAADVYGKSKIIGEPEDVSVIRTSFIGEEANRKLSLLEWVRKQAGGECNGYTNHMWNGITALELSKVICNVVTGGDYWTGVRHICSPEATSKYDLIKNINDVYGLGIKIIATEDAANVNRTLGTVHLQVLKSFDINIIPKQILELKEFGDKYFREKADV